MKKKDLFLFDIILLISHSAFCGAILFLVCRTCDYLRFYMGWLFVLGFAETIYHFLCVWRRVQRMEKQSKAGETKLN